METAGLKRTGEGIIDGKWRESRPACWPEIEEIGVEAARTESDWVDIRASLDGDDAAYAQIVERYQPQIFKQMWRFSRDPDVQQELVQEVFIEVYKSLKRFKGEAPLLHWIRRIATRVGYRYWKYEARRKQLREALEREPLPGAHAPEVQEPSEAAESLHRFLARLRPKDRLVLTLMYFEDLSTRQIAERVGWNENLVRVRAHRARQRLKKLLEQAGFGR
jgi:RNA polymerase sigma-70 factor (ECF subfamily)